MDEARKKKLIWQLPFLTLLIVGTILIIRQQHVMPYQKNAGLIFGTTYNITYQNDEDLHKEVLAKLKEVDGALSMFNEKSTITKINNNEDVTPSEMFTDVFQLAQKISQETNGSFDITVAPLVNIWGFGFKKGEEPSKHAIDSLKALIGYQKVSYDGKRVVKKDPRITLDCSAIAKGYGADVVARLLDEKGIKNYLVEIGGEVVTRGISEKRVPWKIGVTKPTEDPTETGDLQTVLNVTDKAMATSGNYRNFYYKGGKKYAHTIDPKTGYPVQHNILSATVLCDECARADAFATAFMVMGLERAKKVLEKNPDLMVYFIYDKNGQNDVWFSPSLKDKILQ
jgi:thiamine biosynthesis lipoprotein